ncbi:MAG: TraB/GumN family protein, partial [Flavobacteriales bacterium]
PILYQAEMLYEFVSLSSKGLHLDVMALSDSLIIQTYLNQCLNDFVVLSKEIEFDEQLMDQLLPRRNLRFVNRLGPLMTQKSVFCAVGALHLPGNDGMIALLRSQGFKVFPVRFEFLEK